MNSDTCRHLSGVDRGRIASRTDRPGGEPRLRIEGSTSNRPAVSYLSWDTEGGPRVEQNLLRPNESLGVAVLRDGTWQSGRELSATTKALAAGGREYSIASRPTPGCCWSLVPGKDRLTMTFSTEGIGCRQDRSGRTRLPARSERDPDDRDPECPPCRRVHAAAGCCQCAGFRPDDAGGRSAEAP